MLAGRLKVKWAGASSMPLRKAAEQPSWTALSPMRLAELAFVRTWERSNDPAFEAKHDRIVELCERAEPAPRS